MNRTIIIFIISPLLAMLIPSYAQDSTFVVDLGVFPLQTCVLPQNSASPNLSNNYRTGEARGKAKVFVDPPTSRAIAVANECANRARIDLDLSRSQRNLNLFSETFNAYMQECAIRSQVGIRSVRAVISIDGSC